MKAKRIKTKNSFVIIALISILASCATDFKKKSFDLADAKGESNAEEIFPRTAVGNMRLPIGSPHQETLIKGTCFFTQPGDDFSYPLKFVRVKIVKDNRILSETNTDEKGAFVFHSNFKPGKYTILVESTKYSGKKVLNVEKVKHEDVILKVQRTNDM